MRIEPLTPAIGATVKGLDLATPLMERDIRELRAALDGRLVLFFEQQSLSAAQQRDFSSRFGELYKHPFYPASKGVAEIMILENDAARRPSADRWHNDATYLQTPPGMGILFAEEIPRLGGDTLWASMYAAYDALSDSMQDLVLNLRAIHSFEKNFTPERFAAMGMEESRDRMYALYSPVSHPVARTNAVNRRKALFVNQDFTTHIVQLSMRESDGLLRLLYEHMAQPEFQVRWRWRVGDVAMWDNRWAQHCALGDYYPQRRVVRRATIVGERPV